MDTKYITKEVRLYKMEEKMEKLNLETLEKKLWDCADILRGTLNSSQYMEYIFGMLFLKRINDQFSVERREKEEKFAKLPVEAREKVLEDANVYVNLKVYQCFT